MFVFVEIQPRWPVSADPIRVCSAADRRAQTWNGQVWLAALHDPGSLSLTLFDGDFGRDLETGASSISIAEKALEQAGGTAHRDVRWESASVSIWSGNFTTAPGVGSYPYANDVALRFVGRVSRFEKDGNSLKLTLSSAGEAGDTDVLNLEYAGTGGAEGGADKKGVLKPWVFGAAKNVEPILIDEDNSVYQFSAYGPIKAVTALYERGSSFGAATGDHANYAALVAATIPAGRWATCLAAGMVRLGAPQFGVITGDIEGDYFGSVFRRKPGAILQRIATARGIDSAQIDTDSLDALDTFAATLPGGGNINFELKSQTSFIALARRLCAPFNAQAGFSLLGKLFACRVGIGTPSFTLDSRGRRLPLVSSMIEGDTPPPFSRMVMAADYSHREHDLSTEVAFYATPRPAGDYDAAETYREGDVISLPDGSTWLYINPTATSGNYPPTSGSFWSQLSGPIQAASNFTLTSVANATVVSPNRVAFAPTSGFNGRVKTVQGGVAASITADVSAGMMLGLTSDPDALGTNGYDAIDFAFHKDSGSGNFFSYHNSASPSLAMGGAPSAQKMRVTCDGATVYYYCDNVLMGQTPVPAADVGKVLYGVIGHNLAVEVGNIAYSVDGVLSTDARLTNESHTLAAATDGTVSSYAGASGTFKIEKNGVDISGSFTLSTAANPQSLTVGYTGMAYSVTAGFDAGEDNASLTIRATGSGAFTGITIDKVFSLSKSKTGAGGAAGSTGVSIRKIWQRSATAPSAPAASSGTPSGWFDDPSGATGSNPLYASTGERAAGGTNYTWTTPVRDEAITATQTGQSTVLGFSVSSTLSFTLLAGQSREVIGQTDLQTPTGGGSAYIQIEYREAGGSWTADNGPSVGYAVGEPVQPYHSIFVSNSGTETRNYEVRGTVVRSNTNSGPVTTSRSNLVI